MPTVLYVYNRPASFIKVDRDLLAERFEVEDWFQPRAISALSPVRLVKLVAALRRSDAVVGWWASWHTIWPVTLARLMRKPSALIIGGFDVADMPEIGYGFQQGGPRRWMSRWTLRHATRLMTNSRYSQGEAQRNAGLEPARVPVTYHGVPDPFGELPAGEREAIALCVGYVTRLNLEVKGQRAFVETAARLPEVSFVVAGKHDEDAMAVLRPLAGPNVNFTGWLDDEQLQDCFRRASVYVQPSHHEGFGISVAEAMLAGCVPVVTRAGALPEVVGDAGVIVEGDDPEVVADGVRAALAMGPDARRRARDRILEHFSLHVRREGLSRLMDGLLQAPPPPSYTS